MGWVTRVWTLFRRWPTWVQIGVAVTLVFGGVAAASEGPAGSPVADLAPFTTTGPTREHYTTVPASTTTTAPAPTPTAPPATTASTPNAIAVRSVTDGDTIMLVDGRRVRLAQVDAPETDECFGSQSTAALRALIGDKPVTLRRPSNGPETDKYGRTLAEVSVAGVSVDEALVRAGAAEWYQEFASEDADIARRLNAAEVEARAAGRGLWSACSGGSAAPALPTPATRAPSTTPSVNPPPTGNCHPAYPDACIPPAPPDLDCADIGRSVTVDHRYGDPHRLDADGDGVGCESYG